MRIGAVVHQEKKSSFTDKKQASRMITQRTTARTRDRPIAVSPRAAASAPRTAKDDRVARQNRHRDDQNVARFVLSCNRETRERKETSRDAAYVSSRVTLRRSSHAHLTSSSSSARLSPIVSARCSIYPSNTGPAVSHFQEASVESCCVKRAWTCPPNNRRHDRLALLLTFGAVYINAPPPRKLPHSIPSMEVRNNRRMTPQRCGYTDVKREQ